MPQVGVTSGENPAFIRQNPDSRIIDWLGLEGTSKITLFQFAKSAWEDGRKLQKEQGRKQRFIQRGQIADGILPGRSEVAERGLWVQSSFIVLQKWDGHHVLCHILVLRDQTQRSAALLQLPKHG